MGSNSAHFANGDVVERISASPLDVPEELLEKVVQMLRSTDRAKVVSAAANIEYLVASSLPRGRLPKWGIWPWSARGAERNRDALGKAEGIWERLLELLKLPDPEVTSQVCGAMSKMVFRHEANARMAVTHPGMLDALTDLLDGSAHCFLEQEQAWRVLQNCISCTSSNSSIKATVCESERLLEFLREACTCSLEQLRMRAVSVVMHASSNDQARVCLRKVRHHQQHRWGPLWRRTPLQSTYLH